MIRIVNENAGKVDYWKRELETQYYSDDGRVYNDVIDEMSDDRELSDEEWQEVYDWGVEKGYIPAIKTEGLFDRF